MSDTPRTDSGSRIYPRPENAQLIQFEGCTSVVMLPDEYEELYEHARNLERELNECIETLHNIAHRQIVTTLDAVVVKDMAFRSLEKIGATK